MSQRGHGDCPSFARLRQQRAEAVRCRAQAVAELERNNPEDAAGRLYFALMHAADAWAIAHGRPEACVGYEKFHVQVASWPEPWARRWSSCVSRAVLLKEGREISIGKAMASCRELLVGVDELLLALAADDPDAAAGRS